MTDLTQPTAPATEPERLAHLRTRAAARLKGAAATKGPVSRAADALAVLHVLASSPATAPDALTLLHELQVHQVELDLQAQELKESRAELETALRRQIELYDSLPTGCFTIDRDLALHELNETGADMLGMARGQVLEHPFDVFLGAGGARRLRLALAGLDTGTRRATCRVTLRPQAGAPRPVIASIGKDPAADRYLVSLTDAGDGPDDGAGGS